MCEKTEDLLLILKNDGVTYEDYLFSHGESFIDCDITAFWERILRESKMKKTDIINKADIGYTYFYDVINGKKTPSRDLVIKLILALKASVDDCQEILRIYEWAALYPKIKRDSIIIFAINHGYGLNQAEELLRANNEKSLKRK